MGEFKPLIFIVINILLVLVTVYILNGSKKIKYTVVRKSFFSAPSFFSEDLIFASIPILILSVFINIFEAPLFIFGAVFLSFPLFKNCYGRKK